MRICSGSGCLRTIQDDERFCDECKPVMAIPDGSREHSVTDRDRYAFLYSSARWQRVRGLAIRACPLCAVCGLSISEIVDHIVPAGVAIAQARDSGRYKTDRYAGFYMMSNLQGLCRQCHYDKTLSDKTHVGPWANAVEKEALMPKRKWAF